MNKAPDPAVFRRLNQYMRTHDVVLREGKGIPKRVVHVGLCCRVDDRVDLFRFKNVPAEAQANSG